MPPTPGYAKRHTSSNGLARSRAAPITHHESRTEEPHMNDALRMTAAMAFALSALAIAADVAAQAAVLDRPVAWSLVRPLQTARAYHTATLLPNGKVLVAGGEVDPPYPASTNSAELYDPSTGLWSATAAMHSARAGHVAIALANGKTLVLGEGVPFGEVYDTAMGTWSDASSPLRVRHRFSATLLRSGKVLIAGGVDEDGTTILHSAELYDPATNQWTAAGGLAIARYGEDATLLADGRVLVVGGFNDFGDDFFPPSPLSSAELYDPAADAWSPTGSVLIARQGDTETLLANGTVLRSGGSTNAEIYDATGSWHLLGAPNRARSAHTATLLPDGRVLIAGGLGPAPPGSGALASAQLYDPQAAAWTDAATLNVGRAFHTATPLPGGGVLVAGGVSVSGGGAIVTALASAEIYQALPPPADIPFRITALFSEQGGFYQFILLQRLGSGGDNHLAGRRLTVTSSSGVVKSYTFPSDPPASASTLCISTRGLTSIPSDYPDYLIPDQFLPTGGGTINLAGTDSWSFGPLAQVGFALVSRDGSESSDNPFTMSCALRKVALGIETDPVIEYHSAALDHYFITASQPDIDALDSGRIPGWTRTGESFSAWITRTPSILDDPVPAGLLDVCRYYIPAADGDSHFYSASPSECAAAKAQHPEYELETPAAFLATLPDPHSGACPALAKTPVYRLWNGRTDSNHRYTTSLDVRSRMIAGGYISEGYGPDGVALCEE
jgi:hypothetical protein